MGVHHINASCCTYLMYPFTLRSLRPPARGAYVLRPLRADVRGLRPLLHVLLLAGARRPSHALSPTRCVVWAGLVALDEAHVSGTHQLRPQPAHVTRERSFSVQPLVSRNALVRRCAPSSAAPYQSHSTAASLPKDTNPPPVETQFERRVNPFTPSSFRAHAIPTRDEGASCHPPHEPHMCQMPRHSPRLLQGMAQLLTSPFFLRLCTVGGGAKSDQTPTHTHNERRA